MGKVFACSDLHGQYDLFKQIREFLGKDDVCYVLGDCVDRGTGSIKILLDIITDKRFKMIKGNHEEMMVEALQAAEEGYMDFQLWYMNGGDLTHAEFMSYDRPTQLGLISFCKRLPIMLEYKDKILTHAGFEWTVDEPDEDMLLWDRSHIQSVSTSPEGKIQVHGHTPVQHIKRGSTEVLRYGDKICIDTGSCFVGKIQLLDLDTLETMTFEREEY